MLLVACESADPRNPEAAAERASDVVAAESDSVAELGRADTSVPAFSDRVAVFMEAAPAVLDSILSAYDDVDRGIVGDDLMYYRSSAYDFFDQEGIRVVRLEGRPLLRFEIDGAMKDFDFAAVRSADVIVLYDPGKAPQAIAPVDLHVAQEYFGLSASEQG